MRITIAAVAMLLLAAPSTAGAPRGKAQTDPRTRAFRTVIAEARARAPDFARHHQLIMPGCGAECVMPGAVDVRSGAVAWLPWTVCCWGDAVDEPVRWSLKSEVIEVTGMLDETGPSATRRFRLVGGRFVQVD